MKKFLGLFLLQLMLVGILGPHLQKIHHYFTEHQEYTCTHASELHIHKAELNCELHKQQLVQKYLPIFFNFEEPYAKALPEYGVPPYTNFVQVLPPAFQLRGPPSFSNA